LYIISPEFVQKFIQIQKMKQLIKKFDQMITSENENNA